MYPKEKRSPDGTVRAMCELRRDYYNTNEKGAERTAVLTETAGAETYSRTDRDFFRLACFVLVS